MTDKSRALLVAVGDGQVVGYVTVFTHPTLYANGPVGWIEELMVAEYCRRVGVGALLVAAAEQWAVAHHAALVALATRRAETFWDAVGFTKSATYLRKLL